MPRSRGKLSQAELASELGALESDADRRKFLTRNKSLLRSEVVKRLAPLVVEKIQVDAGLALCLAEGTLVIARKLRSKEDREGTPIVWKCWFCSSRPTKRPIIPSPIQIRSISFIM